MKKTIILSFIIALLITSHTNAKDRMIDYSDFEKNSDLDVYEIPAKTEKLTILNIPLGKTIYIAKTNTGKDIIPKEMSRHLIYADGITLNTKNYDNQNETKNITPTQDFAPPRIFTKHEKLYNFDSEKEKQAKKNKIIKEKTFELGSQKDIFLDVNSSMNIYEKKSVHLTAKGKYCYVWTEDDCFNPIIEKTATNLANAFDSMYLNIRSVFGKESDVMYSSYNGKYFDTKHIEFLSETGKFVNIVIYDIGAKNNGVVGYFYSKDYFPRGKEYIDEVLNYSNEGKYIYIDSQWAEADEKICISTIAHEFEHMINYNQKSIVNETNSNDAFNEMMALICENIISPETINASLNSRLAMFNSDYADCGLEYRGNSHYHAMLSYAVNYAFGTWLIYKYGKTKFIKDMSTNPYPDIKAITHASGESIKNLLKMFCIDCISKTQSDFCLWKLNKTEYDTSGYKYDGPRLFPYNTQHELRPYGILLIKAGKTESNTVTLNFSSEELKNKEFTYIFVE